MKIIIHGGFFSESDQSHEVKTAKQNSLQRIAHEAFDYLQSNSAFDTVAYAVSLLENDLLYNAGTGSQIQADGIIRMSAAIMDGQTQKLSGVINIQNVKNPVFVAKALMQEDDRVLGGEGAKAYAAQHGFEDYSTEIPQRRKEYEEKIKNGGKGTVGCVAIDKNGHLAAATSTGGKGFEIPGRISDSATVAGNYANPFCAVSCTGVGEDIVSNATAAKIVTRVTDGMDLKTAFDRTFEELKAVDGFAGAIAVDRHGNVYHQDSYPTMVFASFDGTEFTVFS
ncbi:isoaspartyl peptidase/L-asparaginase [uncultured Chryseobacterium sp.]|uniref:isoaspartyl peptidase/L-asparaginase n=1 Tax=uncultured Chryseobacterium sp. TaxID=259322 RepID=UPI0025D562C1|nr:isoaspartyl peptidase/L-asparaginase [uncultured Chryseobacterium sp.]